MSNLTTDRSVTGKGSDWRLAAVTAGATYALFLIGVATLLGIARSKWIELQADPDTALAIEALVLLPCAWGMCSLVAQAMRLPDGWRPVAVMSIVSLLLLVSVYAAVSVIAYPGDSLVSSLLASSIVMQGLIAAIPFTLRSAARQPEGGPAGEEGTTRGS